MFITKEEKNLINYRIKELEESMSDCMFKLGAIESVLNKILKHLEPPKPPAKKRGRPPGVKNKPKKVHISASEAATAKKVGVSLDAYAQAKANYRKPRTKK